jgi:hypothetical protein
MNNYSWEVYDDLLGYGRCNDATHAKQQCSLPLCHLQIFFKAYGARWRQLAQPKNDVLHCSGLLSMY